jgi:hypothetical protein
MSVMDEIKQLEKEIRSTLGKSFSYGFYAGLFWTLFVIFLITGISQGFNLVTTASMVIGFFGYLALKLKQRLYATDMFNNTLAHAHDEKCTCGETCTCEKEEQKEKPNYCFEDKGDKVEHL